MMRRIKQFIAGFLASATLVLGVLPAPAQAHGERATEPYIRTRTVHWYDVTWSTSKVNVNDSIVVEGKFRLFKDWPEAVDRPEMVYLSSGAPAAMLVREESYISELPARQSHKALELGRDYSFKMVMRGRVPGEWHLHPMLNVAGAGPVIGPGAWVKVEGRREDFKQPVTTLHGLKIDNVEKFNVSRVQKWHLLHISIAAAWLVWWLRRPLIIPRWKAKELGREDLLVTKADDRMAVLLLVLALAVTIVGFVQIKKEFPQLVPLQAGVHKPEPLPTEPEWVKIKFKRAEYDVPGRSMRISAEFTNVSNKPVSIGEFTTAGLRFINKGLPAAVLAVDPGFPKELVPASGLSIDKPKPLQPGETRLITIDASDAAWEVERLVSFLTNVDSRTGGLLFLYDQQGKRSIAEIAGPIIPVFKGSRI